MVTIIENSTEDTPEGVLILTQAFLILAILIGPLAFALGIGALFKKGHKVIFAVLGTLISIIFMALILFLILSGF